MRDLALTRREQTRRRLTLLSIAGLLLLSTSPVFWHHLPVAVDRLLVGMDHVGAVCVTALHLLLAPVHRGFHVVLVAGFAYALWDRVRAWRRARALLGALQSRRPAPDDRYWRAAADARLDPRRVRVVRGLPVPAFTVGMLRPRVYVAGSLASRLTAGELTAVLAHERAHLDRRDPLRLACLRALACTLFWIPALRRLSADVTDEAEVLADDAAAGDRPLVLARAILALASWPTERRHARLGVGFGGADLLDRRIRRLAGEEVAVRSHVTRRSIAGAAGALALVWISGVLMAHPLPSASELAHERHCDHRRQSAIAHLFCLGSPFKDPAEDCPHAREI